MSCSRLSSFWRIPQNKQRKTRKFIELVQAADMEIKETFTQNLKSITLRTYIGTGKCEEIMHTCRSRKYNALCFNHDLSPLQIRNLEEILQTPVMDRTELILAIFLKAGQSHVPQDCKLNAHS